MALPNVAVDGSARALEVVKLLADSGSSPRLAMRGTSMLPLLREPMVLTLGPCGPRHRLGEIVVFERDGQFVAHRITSVREGVIQTCGDAHPWSPEYPPESAIVGRVVAVMESDGPDAARVDTPLYQLRGSLKARFRRARAVPFYVAAFFGRFVRALPWRRVRAYVRLVQLMSAAVRDDKVGFERALRAADPMAIAAVARRHACSATLVETAAQMKSSAKEISYLRSSLQEVSRSVVLRGMALRSQIATIVGILGRSGISFALLKGAARLYRDEPHAVLHASTDLDILVRAADLDTATQALRSQGYSERADAQAQEHYHRRHHHAAPLFPPGNGCAIELHVSLAPPGYLSIPLDWAALEPHLMRVEGESALYCLDDVGTALHYAVHSIGMTRLRDCVLLALLLRRLDAASMDELRRIVMSERIDPIRLDASVALAARMAGVRWPVTGPVEEYLRWCMRREDVPLYFSQRSQLAEGWYAGDRRVTPLLWRLLDPRSGLSDQAEARPAPLTTAGRIVTGLGAYLYTLAMRPVA
ncbi:MAG: nucleotidyltransferase family protein [Candidatus Eremiobacteraeota bacterium]|nr:nucleotidyltransferase family protein [Candidatus Eremiobacteraeota bacterium]